MNVIVAIVLFFFVTMINANEDFDRDQIEQRIKPIGAVHVDKIINKERAPVVEPEKAVPSQAVSGQAIYERYCVICHRDGVAGAPKFRADDWKQRLATKKLSGLVASAMKGLNAMPPKGTCSECSEDDIKLALQYMLPP